MKRKQFSEEQMEHQVEPDPTPISAAYNALVKCKTQHLICQTCQGTSHSAPASRECHAEAGGRSISQTTEILRSAQDDMPGKSQARRRATTADTVCEIKSRFLQVKPADINSR